SGQTIERLFYEIRRKGSLDCRARLYSEPGFERAHTGACCRDSASESFCRCQLRLLERGTELARRNLFIRSGIGARSLCRPEFHQRGLFHADGSSARARVEWTDHKTAQRSNLEIL